LSCSSLSRTIAFDSSASPALRLRSNDAEPASSLGGGGASARRRRPSNSFLTSPSAPPTLRRRSLSSSLGAANTRSS